MFISHSIEYLKADVLVVGSEGAGARAALEAVKNNADVIMISKGYFGGSGATVTAGADIDLDSASVCQLFDLPGVKEDNKDIFFEDMVIEGRYINNQKLAEVHVDDAVDRLKELRDWGIKITGLISAPGHRYPRGVYTSGREIMRVLKKQIKLTSVNVLEHVMVLDLIKKNKQVIGAIALNLKEGSFIVIQAKSTILATGGGMMVFPYQTAPEELTGDGQAMAWRAGADLVDMEMTQFLPGVFIKPPIWKGLAFPFMLGPMGGLDVWLLNKYGNRYMNKWDPKNMERSTRDLLSRALMNEVRENRGSPSGGVWMSFAHLPANLIDYVAQWYAKPYLTPDWTYKGFDFREFIDRVKNGYAIEVGVASHFFMGGIRIDTECKTSVEGLFAAGEVAGGLHGANRLSGNACTQILVQGARAGRAAAELVHGVSFEKPDLKEIQELINYYELPLKRESGVTIFKLKKEMQDLAWKSAGVIRCADDLSSGLEKIKQIKDQISELSCQSKEKQYNKEWVEALQLPNLATVLEGILISAEARKESRGAHYRKDFPSSDDKYLFNHVIINRNNNMVLKQEPLEITRMPVPGCIK